jgi:CDGSH-type Zn-finger protein
MSKPIIAHNGPKAVQLEQGKQYAWCACGRSGNQPFCDGSHAGTGFNPKLFTVEADGEAWLCRCKHTNTPPYCDGTHKQFGDDQVGQEGP